MNEQARKPTDGVALAAIVAKETTHGKWSGSGGGLGFGTGGVGLFVGGMSGTKHDQTERARELKGPEKPSFNWWYVYAPAIALMGTGILFGVAPSLLSLLDLDSGAPTPPAVAPLDEALDAMMSMLVFFPPLLGVLALGFFLFFSSSRSKKATVWHNEEKDKFAIKESVYHRLRYVESDHVVFDPLTMKEVQADKSSISNLLEELSALELAKN